MRLLYVLDRTIHGSEEAALFLDLGTHRLGFIICYRPGVKIGIYGHLLTGHCVERKSCGNFGNSLGTFVDDHELDDYQDYEYDRTHYQITATDE